MNDAHKSPAWRRYLRFWGSDLPADVDEEIRFHLDMHVAEYIKRGMSPGDARRASLERFGSIDRARTQTIDIDRRQMQSEVRDRALADLRQDIAFGGRMLRRQPLPTGVSMLCLALGIAGTTAMFSVGHTMLVRPMPYPNGDRLVSIKSIMAVRGPGVSSIPDYADLRARQRTFTEIGAATYQDFTLLGREPTRIVGARVTASLFRALGVSAEAGRVFTDEEDRPGAPKVVVVSHGFAMRRLGGVSRAVGAALDLGAGKHTVVGVLADNARYPERAEIWVPLAKDPARESRGSRWLSLIGALRPGVDVETARRDARGISAAMVRDLGLDSASSATFQVDPLRDSYVRSARPALIALACATMLVLLVACANVAGLQLARTTARAREIAVRAAIGASRARLIRQLLTENVLLAIGGGVLGCVLAVWGTRALGASVARAAPAWMTFRLDLRALLFTLGVSVLTGIAFGAAPALRLARLDASSALRGGRALGLTRAGLQRAFVVAEIALCLVLLVGAGFALESVYRLSHVSLGFDPAGVMAFRVSLQGAKYDSSAARAQTIDELATRVAALPGVQAAGGVTRIPIVGCCSQFGTNIEGQETPPGLMVTGNMITPGYFATMRIPLIRGRVFTSSDDGNAPRVVIVNETFAKRFWPSGDALGHRTDTGGGWATIVGVVGDVKQNALTDTPEPQFYRPHAQDPWEDMWYAIRVGDDKPARVMADVRRIFREIDPTQPIFSASTMDALIERGLVSERTLGRLLAGFALVALLLAMAGVYAVMSFVVSQRMPELGLRVALGADRRRVLGLVLRDGATVALIGAALGLAGAVAAAKALAHSLYGVEALEPVVYVVSVAALVVTALIATLAPARRASAADPMIALRADG
jgi:predicted permease